MAVGVFGGTFDPVHIGHLRVALELKEHLGLSAMHMIPSARPPHREQPATSAEHRFAMLQLALANEAGMVADDREIRRKGMSYSIDTLSEVRAEVGAEPLYLCIGMDALLTLNCWHRWRDLLDFAHIVVTARPGWKLPSSGEVIEWVGLHRAEVSALAERPCGHVAFVEMALLPVSATGIRQALQRGASIRYLVPDAVLDYIAANKLYPLL